MNETGKFFAWPLSWLQQAQWPIRWQDEISNDADSALINESKATELAQVADYLTQVIIPVTPDPQFRAELKTKLLIAHTQQGTRRGFFPPLTESPLRSWQVIATVPVVVGVAALIWRYSQRSAGQSLEAA